MNTMEGLKPLYDDDYDEKRKLKLGQVYEANIRVPRNLQFHRKYMKLIRVAWELLGEKAQAFFKTTENFRKSMELTAGHSEPLYNCKTNEFIQQAKSISFSSMEQDEFEELYERVKDVIWGLLDQRGLVDYGTFNKYLRDF